MPGGTTGAWIGALGSGEAAVDASVRPNGPPGSNDVATINAPNPASPAPKRGQIGWVSRAEGKLTRKPMRSSS